MRSNEAISHSRPTNDVTYAAGCSQRRRPTPTVGSPSPDWCVQLESPPLVVRSRKRCSPRSAAGVRFISRRSTSHPLLNRPQNTERFVSTSPEPIRPACRLATHQKGVNRNPTRMHALCSCRDERRRTDPRQIRTSTRTRSCLRSPPGYISERSVRRFVFGLLVILWLRRRPGAEVDRCVVGRSGGVGPGDPDGVLGREGGQRVSEC